MGWNLCGQHPPRRQCPTSLDQCFAFGDGLEGHDRRRLSALIPCAAMGCDFGGQPGRRPKPTPITFLIMTRSGREATLRPGRVRTLTASCMIHVGTNNSCSPCPPTMIQEPSTLPSATSRALKEPMQSPAGLSRAARATGPWTKQSCPTRSS